MNRVARSVRPAPVAGMGAILAASLAAVIGLDVMGLRTLEQPGLFTLTVGRWADILPMAAFSGACGLVGGLAFRALRGRDPRDWPA